MPTQLDIKRRIRSVKNTQQITRAMKFVAAARLRRAQERAFAARPYARAVSRLVHSVALRVPQSTHTLLERREEKRILLLAVSGERGLCGAFNANVIRRTLEFAREHSAQNPSLIVLGRKIRDAMRKQRWKIIAEHVDVTARPSLGAAEEISKDVISLYESGEIDAVYIVFNEFKSVLAQILRLEKLLPIDPDRALAGEGAQKNRKKRRSIIFTSSRPAKSWGICCRATCKCRSSVHWRNRRLRRQLHGCTPWIRGEKTRAS